MVNKKLIGLILILIGLLNFASRQGWLSGDFFLIGLGAIFMIAYFVRNRPLGFLIPASVLIMIGVFINVQSSNFILAKGKTEGTIFFFFLAIAFYLIFFIHNAGNENQERKIIWPAIVGTALTAFAIFIYFVEYLDISKFAFLADRFWPVVLIVIGLYLILTKQKKD